MGIIVEVKPEPEGPKTDGDVEKGQEVQHEEPGNLKKADTGNTEDSDDEDVESRIQTLIMALLPIMYWDLCTVEGRRGYCDHLTERFTILSWLPFIIIMVLAHAHEQAAIWTAFGLMAVIVAVEYYHHTYKPEYARFYWLNWTNFFCYLGLGIAYEFRIFTHLLISPIQTSAFVVGTLLSMICCSPFTMQFARPKVPKEYWHTKPFFNISMLLTGVWLIAFGIMALCSWLYYFYYAGWSNAVQIIVGTIIPLAIPIVLVKNMEPIANCLKSKFFAQQQGKREEGTAIGEGGGD